MRVHQMAMLASVALYLIGCSSSQPRIGTRTSTIEVYESTTLFINRNPDDQSRAFVHLPLAGSSAYQQAILYFDTSDGMRDSLLMQIESSGAVGAATSIIAKFTIPANYAPASLRIGLEQGSRYVVYPAEFVSIDEQALRLTPFIRNSGTSTMIGLDALRVRRVDGEYLPSSEDIRVIIRQSIKPIWQSNQGMSFLTVVTPVRPELPGEHSVYTLEWDGTDNNGTPLPPGEYTADIVIPARPAPYLTQLTFSWPLNSK